MRVLTLAVASLFAASTIAAFAQTPVSTARPVVTGKRLDGHLHENADAKFSVCFVPMQNCTPVIAEKIAAATKKIRMQAYGFTSPPIIAALVDAKKRGVDIEIILDKSNDDDKSDGQNVTIGADNMDRAGIPVWIDNKPAIAHNKVIIIDDELVIGGSFNYTTSAERRNAENVTFTVSKVVAGWYTENFESRKAVSVTIEDYHPPVKKAP